MEDCAIVLNAIYGPDGHDRTVGADPFHWEPHKPLNSLRVGILQTSLRPRARQPQKKIYDQALDDLKKAGVNADPRGVRGRPVAGIRFLLEAEGAAAFDDITRDGQVRTLSGQAPGDWPNTLPQFAPDPGSGVHPRAAGPHAADGEIREVHGGLGRAGDAAGSLLTTTNLTGNPQVVVKCGFTEGAKSDGTKSRCRDPSDSSARSTTKVAAARGAGLRAGHRVA